MEGGTGPRPGLPRSARPARASAGASLQAEAPDPQPGVGAVSVRPGRADCGLAAPLDPLAAEEGKVQRLRAGRTLRERGLEFGA